MNLRVQTVAGKATRAEPLYNRSRCRFYLPTDGVSPLIAIAFLLGGASACSARLCPTASRVADAQIGIGYSPARPGYVQQTFQGVSRLRRPGLHLHLGVEAEFHQVNSTSGDQSYQRTYEVGGRYFRTYGPLRALRQGHDRPRRLQLPHRPDRLAYTLFAGGAGADFKLGTYLRVRGEYEFQKWTSFPNGGLTPQVVTIGVAYHFAGKPGYK